MIPITDDYMFKSVFSDRNLLKKLLERILPDIEIGELEGIIPEDTIQPFSDTHGIRFDIYAETCMQMFNTEMQNRIADYSPKRARYSGDMMDVNCLSKGVPYEKLKDSYVIIITPEDPFGENRMVYTAETSVQSSGRLAEGKKIIYVNCSGTKGQQEYPQLIPFCRYVMGRKTDDAFVKEIDTKVKYYSRDKTWRENHMEWEQYRMNLILKSEAKGRQEGIEKGREEGREEGMNTQFNCLLKLGIDREQALKYVCEDYPQYSRKEIRKILCM